MKKSILFFTILLFLFSVSSWAGQAIDIKEKLVDRSIARPDPSRVYAWYNYATFAQATTYFSGYVETAVLYQLVDFSLTYPATIQQVSAAFYDPSEWDSSTFHFKIYGSDGTTLLHESGDLTAVSYAEYFYTLPTPLIVTGDFYVAVATDPASTVGAPYVLGTNTLNGHSYNGSAGAWTIFPTYELIHAVYLEGTIPVVPIFVVTPDPYDFGNIEPLDVFTQVFTFSNAGGGTITIAHEGDITLTGDTEFSIIDIIGVPGTLPSDTISVEVQYAPLAVGSHSTVLSIDWGTTRDITTVDIIGNSCNHPANDDCINAELITGPYPATGSGDNECTYIDCPGLLDWYTVWYEIDLPYVSNDLEITICADDADPASVGVVIMDDCACDDYIVRDGGLGWIICPGDTLQGYNMIFPSVPGPSTWLWPAHLIGADGGISFEYEVNVTEETPNAPEDINVAVTGSIVTVSWTYLTELTYTVYSDTDPYGTFMTVEGTGIAADHLDITPIPGVPKFYRVTCDFPPVRTRMYSDGVGIIEKAPKVIAPTR